MEGKGEYDPTETENKNPVLDSALDNDDKEEEIDTTQPLQPGAASTPYQPPGAASDSYHGGEAHEMSEFGPEQSGLADKTPSKRAGLEYNHKPISRCQCNRS